MEPQLIFSGCWRIFYIVAKFYHLSKIPIGCSRKHVGLSSRLAQNLPRSVTSNALWCSCVKKIGSNWILPDHRPVKPIINDSGIAWNENCENSLNKAFQSYFLLLLRVSDFTSSGRRQIWSKTSRETVLFRTNDPILWTHPPHRFWEIWDLGFWTKPAIYHIWVSETMVSINQSLRPLAF